MASLILIETHIPDPINIEMNVKVDRKLHQLLLKSYTNNKHIDINGCFVVNIAPIENEYQTFTLIASHVEIKD